MNEDNLARYPFFAWVGALPLARGATRRTLAQMRSAAQLLSRPGRALWIFPQGRQRPAHLRPLAPAPGVAWLSRTSGASVIPVALDYQFRKAPEPTILVSFGTPIVSSASPLTTQLEAAWSEGLERLGSYVDTGALEGEEAMLALAPRRRPERAMPWAGQLLARLFGAEPEARAERSRADG
jgi:1-acyl-sn-glycerol-3-phosphate acyltransferase